MKITKFTHSCLFIEENKSFLIDPGIFSWNSGKFKLNAINTLDSVIITHNHPDHMHMPFLKALISKFPDLNIIANLEIVQVLKAHNINQTFIEQTDLVVAFDAMHESLPVLDAQVPQNTGYHVNEKITVSGDSFHVTESKEVLALPIIAPWGSTRAAVELAVSLSPKVVIPVHDWHYSNEAREWLYTLLEEELSRHDIQFISTINMTSFSY